MRATLDLAGLSASSLPVVDGEGDRLCQALSQVGVDFAQVTRRLEDEGVSGFEDSWANLLSTVEQALNNARV
jgi:transaldolase